MKHIAVFVTLFMLAWNAAIRVEQFYTPAVCADGVTPTQWGPDYLTAFCLNGIWDCQAAQYAKKIFPRLFNGDYRIKRLGSIEISDEGGVAIRDFTFMRNGVSGALCNPPRFPYLTEWHWRWNARTYPSPKLQASN
jgi:hypothetical protein